MALQGLRAMRSLQTVRDQRASENPRDSAGPYFDEAQENHTKSGSSSSDESGHVEQCRAVHTEN